MILGWLVRWRRRQRFHTLVWHGADQDRLDRLAAQLDLRGRWGGYQLGVAAWCGNAPAVELLVRHGADVGRYGGDALHGLLINAKAVGEARTAVIADLLLANGADPNHQPWGSSATPLVATIRSGPTDLVELLLRYGADPNAADADGCRPLHTALGGCTLPAIKLLLEHGADPDLPGSRWGSPREFMHLDNGRWWGNRATPEQRAAALGLLERPQADEAKVA